MSYDDKLEEKQLLCEDYIGHDYSQVIDMKAINKLYRRCRSLRKFSELDSLRSFRNCVRIRLAPQLRSGYSVS